MQKIKAMFDFKDKKWVQKTKEFFWRKRSKKAKIISGVAVVVIVVTVVLGWHRFSALAQQFIDSFLDTSRVANNWNINVDTGNGEIKLATRTCDDAVWFCSANTVCNNIMGDGTYIIVKRTNETGTKPWKTTNTTCDRPQCTVDGGAQADNLVSDNTVNFNDIANADDYPARQACKAIGGRLPHPSEITCMHANAASFGGFPSADYWTEQEANVTQAYRYNAVNALDAQSKNSTWNVRCVRGW